MNSMTGGRLVTAVPEPPEPIEMFGAVPVQLNACEWLEPAPEEPVMI